LGKATEPTRKKKKIDNGPPTGLRSGWDAKPPKSSAAIKTATKEARKNNEDDAMTQYGGLAADDEDDSVEKAATQLSVPGKKGKTIVSQSFK